MKLTLQQIGEIKNFIQSRGITYLDVQMEIMDHVASAIEEKMNANTNLNFEDALRQTHASFGVLGFSTMEDAIINGMGRRFRKMFWRTFVSFFGLKYIALVLLSGVLIYKTQEFIKLDYYAFTMSLIAIIAVVSILILFSLYYWKYSKFLTYRTSSFYLVFMGSLITLINTVISKIPLITFFGINGHYLLASVILLFFVIYLISAFKTVAQGAKESQLLIDKYELIG